MTEDEIQTLLRNAKPSWSELKEPIPVSRLSGGEPVKADPPRPDVFHDYLQPVRINKDADNSFPTPSDGATYFLAFVDGVVTLVPATRTRVVVAGVVGTYDVAAVFVSL